MPKASIDKRKRRQGVGLSVKRRLHFQAGRLRQPTIATWRATLNAMQKLSLLLYVSRCSDWL